MKKINKIITAIGNPILNDELKKVDDILIINNDIQYQDGIFEILEKDNDVDFIIISQLIPGELNLEDLIEKIENVNEKIKVILILEKYDENLEKILNKNGVYRIFYDNKIEIRDIIKIINEDNRMEKYNQEIRREIDELREFIMNNSMNQSPTQNKRTNNFVKNKKLFFYKNTDKNMDLKNNKIIKNNKKIKDDINIKNNKITKNDIKNNIDNNAKNNLKNDAENNIKNGIKNIKEIDMENSVENNKKMENNIIKNKNYTNNEKMYITNKNTGKLPSKIIKNNIIKNNIIKSNILRKNNYFLKIIKQKNIMENYVEDVQENNNIISILGNSGAGKSVFSVMMAHTLKKYYSKILIIDFDILNNSLHTILGVQKYPEKIMKNINYNKTDIKLSDLVINVDKKIDLISGINLIFDYKEKNNEKEMKEIIKKFSLNYDVVLIDTTTECFFEYTKEIIKMSNKSIFLTEANLLEISKSKRILNGYYENWNIQKNKINIIFNKYNKNSIDINLLKNIYDDYNIIGYIKLKNNYNSIINENIKNINIQNNILKKYENIYKKLYGYFNPKKEKQI